MKLRLIVALMLWAVGTLQAAYDHVFVVVLENVGYEAIVGSPNAPYINNTLIPLGTLYSQSYGVATDSLPNYIALFSGSKQGMTNNNCLDHQYKPNGPFTAPNLYTRLAAKGLTCVGYMESLPYAGFAGCKYKAYFQKHNPFPFFSNVPGTAWVPYKPQTTWPNLAWIIPNVQNDMHNGVDQADKVTRGDTWLSQHMPAIIAYCEANNGLLIVTMDEGRKVYRNHLFTLLIGKGEVPGGSNAIRVDQYGMCRRITDNFGVAPLP